jgi:hypothetical protein
MNATTTTEPQPLALIPLTKAILQTWGIGQILQLCDLTTPGIPQWALYTLSVLDICHIYNIT